VTSTLGRELVSTQSPHAGALFCGAWTYNRRGVRSYKHNGTRALTCTPSVVSERVLITEGMLRLDQGCHRLGLRSRIQAKAAVSGHRRRRREGRIARDS
jgi:hypothetical protein